MRRDEFDWTNSGELMSIALPNRLYIRFHVAVESPSYSAEYRVVPKRHTTIGYGGLLREKSTHTQTHSFEMHLELCKELGSAFMFPCQ